jgi:RNA polymerase sigma-70 factor, ECF subfamily
MAGGASNTRQMASPTSQTAPDELARLRRRDPEALRRAIDDLARPLYRAARGMGFGQTDAEDLVQEVFTTFLTTLDRFEGRSRVSTWVFGILHRKAQERRRELARDDQYDSIDEVFESQFDAAGRWAVAPIDVERQFASGELAGAIRECIDHLPIALREVFTLREMQDLNTAEVCKILGRTVTHVGVQLHRARAWLRACLEAEGWKGTR